VVQRLKGTIQSHFTGHEYASDFPHHRFIAAQISSPLKNEAKIIYKVDPLVLFCLQTYRKPNDAVPLRRTNDQPAAHILHRNYEVRYVREIEKRHRPRKGMGRHGFMR
jgi:hypothetical protein